MWDHAFHITYHLVLSEKELHFNISVYNPSTARPLNFNLLLHTYLKVPDVTRCSVDGLHECHYIDKLRVGQLFRESRKKVNVSSLTDRIYQDTCQEHVITNVMCGKMRLKKHNLSDTVLWNPWHTSRGMKDMVDEEYQGMICVEAGHVSNPVQLRPRNTFHAGQTLQVM
ncbi:hypothetical protein WDU94_004599 [Cyamophila willieti]